MFRALVLAALVFASGPLLLWFVSGMPLGEEEATSIPRIAAGIAIWSVAILPFTIWLVFELCRRIVA